MTMVGGSFLAGFFAGSFVLALVTTQLLWARIRPFHGLILPVSGEHRQNERAGVVTGNGLGRRLQAASETLFERPAAAREGGAIHGTWSARDEAEQAGFEEHTKARARPEPVGRPLGEHGDERKRGSAKMVGRSESDARQLCGIVPSFSLHVGLKRCSSSLVRPKQLTH